MRGPSPVHDALVALIPRLRRYARMLCSDASSADDLVQDTLERACERLAQWQPDTDLRAWLFSIMHNLFVSELRRPRHRFETSSEPTPHPEGDPASGWAMAMDLERALRALPEAQRQVLLLIAFEDMSYEQIAEVTGVPMGTVMSRLSRGRARLRVLLEPGTAKAASGPQLRVLK